MQLSTILAILSAITPFAAADCCYKDEGYCRDGTMGTPYCGVGPCNVLGCDCDGGEFLTPHTDVAVREK